jgi:hypothetical protein
MLHHLPSTQTDHLLRHNLAHPVHQDADSADSRRRARDVELRVVEVVVGHRVDFAAGSTFRSHDTVQGEREKDGRSILKGESFRLASVASFLDGDAVGFEPDKA